MAVSTELTSRFSMKRLEEYKGSTMHFFRSILHKNLESSGFFWLNNGTVPSNEVIKLYANGENYMLK